MVSVTARIRTVTQPRGGYVNPKLMDVRYLTGDGPAPVGHKDENIHATLVGLVVEYLTRLASGAPPEEAFLVSLVGAKRLGEGHLDDALQAIERLTSERSGPVSIAAACQLANYDVVLRAGPAMFNPNANISPDETTTSHIQTMVDRSLRFFQQYGPILVDHPTFIGGYTETVNTGDGDFVTRDTLWDFKVSVNGPTKDHTLQLLMYWLMARRSGWTWAMDWSLGGAVPLEEWGDEADLDTFILEHGEWPEGVEGPVPTHLGVYNPRLDVVWSLPVARIPANVIEEVEREVIGYV